MKRLMLFLFTTSFCIYSSCSTDPDKMRESRMEAADALARFTNDVANAFNPLHLTPAGEAILSLESDKVAVAASIAAGELVALPLTNQINPNIRVPKYLELEFNPYEADGEIHNDALDLIIKEKLAGVDLLEKLKNRDRETIDKFLKLSPKFQDNNVRNNAADVIAAQEVPAGLEDRLTKITHAKDYIEAISYLDMPAEEKVFVTKVFATCNNYYINKVDFEIVAGYLNDKITFLLTKGKDITVKDQKLACMFTIFKHSYYYWHGTK